MRYSLLGDNAGTSFVEAPGADEQGNFIGSSAGAGVIDPLIGPLADNGGPTHTHAILPGSVTLEAGDPVVASDGYDQRGEPFSRVSGRRVDMGAYEALTLIVDSVVDESDDDHSSGDFSLREAIAIANATPGIDFVMFDSELSGRTILLDGQQLEISDAIAIDAGSLDLGIAIDAQSRSRVLQISVNSGDVALTGLKITGGRLLGVSYEQNPFGGSNNSEFNGGGIGSFTSATLKLSDVTITGNRVEGHQVQGGGVFATGPIELRSSIVSNNSTKGREATGGGLHVAGPAYIESSSIERNVANGLRASGGGLYSIGDVGLVESLITDNSTLGDRSKGGGIATLAELRSSASELARNYSVGLLSWGGGASVDGAAAFRSSLIRDNWTEGAGSPGGGVHAGQVFLTQSTVSGNYTLGAYSDGGGIYSAGEVSMSQSTVVDNHTVSAQSSGGGVASEGDISLDGTVVATNESGGDAPDLWTTAGFKSVAYSLIGDRAGTTLAESQIQDENGNLIGDSRGFGAINPRLGPLVPNGGSHPSHRPLSGSPLINAGDSTFDPHSFDPPIVGDARGPVFPRISDGRVDIGSVEEVGVIVVDTLRDIIDGDRSSGELSIREAAEIVNANPGHDTIQFDTSLSGKTILLTEGELLFTEAVTIDATDLGNELTIDAQSQSRVIHLEAHLGDSTLAGLHLTNGLISKSNNYIIPPYTSFFDGGAIRSLSTGDLTLDQTRVTNSASTGSYINGGGIYARGKVVLTGSEVSGNRATGEYSQGGGIHAQSVQVLDSIVSNNVTADRGGGISGGVVSVERSTLSGNVAGYQYPGLGYGDGGAVSAQHLTIIDSSVFGNSAISGGGLSARETLSIIDSSLTENVALRQGGAAFSPEVHVSNSDLVMNVAGGAGGAIYAASARITEAHLASNQVDDSGYGGGDGGALLVTGDGFISRSLFEHNRITGSNGAGGAIYGPNLVVEQTTFYGNAIENYGVGGAIHAIESLSVSASTFTENSAMRGTGSAFASAHGGAISFSDGEVTIAGSTFVRNVSSGSSLFRVRDGRMLVENSILTGSPYAAVHLSGDAELTINNSLIAGGIQPTSGENNTIQNNAMLGPLEDNGGPTPTHLPLPGSPAINKGDASIIFDSGHFDQRGEGYFRVAGSRVDIGAVEVQTAAPDLLGDFNHDGVVDTADYTVWRDTMGAMTATFTGADADGDAEVTQANGT